MKTSCLRVVSLGLALTLYFAIPAKAELLVFQDFNAAPSIASLVDTGSTDTSRFYSISTIPGDASGFTIQGGYTEEQRLPGIGNVGLVGGKLSFSLRAAWQTFYQTGQPPTTRQRDSRTSMGQISRRFAPADRPDLFFWRFKLRTSTTNVADYGAFLQNPSRVNVFAGLSLFELVSDGADRFRFIGGMGPDSIFDEEIEITVLINKTATALSYTAPDETVAFVGASAFDAWVNETLILDERQHLAGTPIDNVIVGFSGTIAAAIQNSNGDYIVPSDPGQPFVFELDDILMRSDFDQTAPPAPVGSAVMALSGKLNFGTKSLGSRNVKTLLIRNTGTVPMTVTRLRYSNPVFSGGFRGTIAGGGAKAVKVTFPPKQARSYRGSVSVSSDSINSPRQLTLSGTGRKR